MFPQDEIDGVLAQAQAAVDSLAADVSQLSAEGHSGPATCPPRPVPSERSDGSSPACTDKVKRILKLRVPVVVRLAERPMPLKEIIKIAPGTILEFDRTVDAELDLLANNQPIGSGVAVKVNEHFGLRVSHVGNLRHRIRSLAS
jgi:flagellar motor switch protein FliN/FliY